MTNFSKNKNSQEIVSKLAAKVLSDRKLLLILSDRVYELMHEDLRHQKERSTNYGRRLDK
jgi:hypothetical protein